jgi:TetR/AcrR family transcriptional repressor of nem operon
MRKECERQLDVWTQNVAKMLQAAKEKHRPATGFDPVEIAWFLNSLWQGSMLVGKTRRTPEMIRRNLLLARRFVDGLFGIEA